jgi:hypothetical protein
MDRQPLRSPWLALAGSGGALDHREYVVHRWFNFSFLLLIWGCEHMSLNNLESRVGLTLLLELD